MCERSEPTNRRMTNQILRLHNSRWATFYLFRQKKQKKNEQQQQRPIRVNTFFDFFVGRFSHDDHWRGISRGTDCVAVTERKNTAHRKETMKREKLKETTWCAGRCPKKKETKDWEKEEIKQYWIKNRRPFLSKRCFSGLDCYCKVFATFKRWVGLSPLFLASSVFSSALVSVVL